MLSCHEANSFREQFNRPHSKADWRALGTFSEPPFSNYFASGLGSLSSQRLKVPDQEQNEASMGVSKNQGPHMNP